VPRPPFDRARVLETALDEARFIAPKDGAPVPPPDFKTWSVEPAAVELYCDVDVAKITPH